VSSSTMSPQPRARPGGRSARVRTAVLTATIELIVESGYDGLRVDDVAARSGVHKTTIYRRWPTMNDLVKAAVQEHTSSAIPMPDTGSAEGDFIEIVMSLARLLQSTVGQAVVRTASIASNDTDDIAEVGRGTWRRQVKAAQVVVRRAIERGELPPVDTTRLYEMLCGPVHLRALTGTRPFNRADARHHVRVVIAGLWVVDGGRSAEQPTDAKH
jgi:AcrR family transcriptional regulator